MAEANGEFNEGSDRIERICFSRILREPCINVAYPDRVVPLKQRIVRHSPDGFEFGYGGSGPSDTALNLLTLFIPLRDAERPPTHYQDFKFEFIATLDQEKGGEIEAEDIRTWIREMRAEAVETDLLDDGDCAEEGHVFYQGDEPALVQAIDSYITRTPPHPSDGVEQ